MKAADAKTMRSIDRAAVRLCGLKTIQLMENAGRAVAETVKREYRACGRKSCRIAVVAGKGNNGGDGYVAARHLKNSGLQVSVFSLAAPGRLKGDAALNASAWQKMGGETSVITSSRALKSCSAALRHSSIIVDALLGTGLSSPVSGLYAEAVDLINGLKKKVVSVDIPSGLDASSGHVLGRAVKADITVTMALPKTGLLVYPGRGYSGIVEVADIGIPRHLLDDERIRWNAACEALVKKMIRPRLSDSHKGTYGHVLVIAGSPGKTGAAYMSAMGAMRAGAGLATIGIPESLNAVMEEKTTEAMTYPLPETPSHAIGLITEDLFKRIADGKSAIVIGPGLGATKEVFRLIEVAVRKSKAPIVIDADGLNALKGNPGLLRRARAAVVITPHPGEAARLLEVKTSDIQADRIGSAERLSRITGSTVVLKGAGTVTARPDGGIYINTSGNPGLASAGTGDVLSGMIGGLLAQGYEAAEAAVASVYVHGRAADEIEKEIRGGIGIIATDILERIPKVFNSLAVETSR